MIEEVRRGARVELFGRINGILFAPETVWSLIQRQRTELGAAVAHVALLAAVPALAGLAGHCLIGATGPNGAVVRVSLAAGLAAAVLDYALAFVAVGVVALLGTLLAPWFGAKPDYRAALKVAAFSFTPYWLLGICQLYPGLHFIAALGVWGLVPARAGLVRLMRAPPARSLGYAAVVTAAAVAIELVAGALPARLLAYLPPL